MKEIDNGSLDGIELWRSFAEAAPDRLPRLHPGCHRADRGDGGRHRVGHETEPPTPSPDHRNGSGPRVRARGPGAFEPRDRSDEEPRSGLHPQRRAPDRDRPLPDTSPQQAGPSLAVRTLRTMQSERTTHDCPHRGPRPHQALRARDRPGRSWTSAFRPGRSSPSWAPTGRARRRSCAPSPPCCVPTPGSLHVAGHDVVREAHAVRRMIGLAGQSAAVEEMMTGRENLAMVARLYGQSRRVGARRQRRHAGPPRPGRGRRPPGQDVLGRDAAPPRPRGQPGGLAPTAPPRRADHRARPPQPHRAVGRHPGPGGGRHRHPAHHPVPRRGRPSGRAHRDHRRREGRGPGIAGRAQTAGGRGRARPAHPRGLDPGTRRRRPGQGLGIGTPSIDAETQRCSIDAPKGSGVLALVVRALDDAGIDVEDITVRHPTLDEVFLKLTGTPAAVSTEARLRLPTPDLTRISDSDGPRRLNRKVHMP